MRQHTPGPWRWMEQELNEKMAARLNKTRRKLSKKDGALVYALKGPPIGNPRTPDEMRDQFDYKNVMTLAWYSVRGDSLTNASPTPADARLIAAAPDLLEELERCRDEFSGAGMVYQAERVASVIAKATGEDR